MSTHLWVLYFSGRRCTGNWIMSPSGARSGRWRTAWLKRPGDSMHVLRAYLGCGKGLDCSAEMVGKVGKGIQGGPYFCADYSLEGRQRYPRRRLDLPIRRRYRPFWISQPDRAMNVRPYRFPRHAGLVRERFGCASHLATVREHFAQVWVAVTHRWVYTQRGDRIHIPVRDGPASAIEGALARCGKRRRCIQTHD